MLLQYLQIFLLFNPSIGIENGINDVTSNPTRSVSQIVPASEVPAPELPIELKTSWIRDFLAFTSHPAIKIQKDNKDKPLDSCIVSDGDESNLISWTRHLVQTDNDYHNAEQGIVSNNVLKIDVDNFIKYLVEHKNFRPKDLDFLRSQDLDYGYDQIEDELDKIKRNQKGPRTVTIGGERRVGNVKGNAGSRPFQKDLPPVILLVCVLAFI